MSEPKDKQTKIEEEIEKEATQETEETVEELDEQNQVAELVKKSC